MQKRILAFTLAISLCHFGFANAQTDQSECQEAIGRYSRASKEISEYARIYGNCIWNSRGRNDAPVSSVLSKMLKTTLKKRFLDIARSADIARKGMTGR
jgi:hypothetical protein